MGLLLSREKKKNRVHAVFYGGILLCAFLLQYVPGVLPRVGGSGTPSLMLLAVVAVAMCEGDVRGGAFGLAAGIFCDANAVHGTGYYAITYMLTGLACGLLVTHLMQNNLLPCISLGIGSVFVNLSLYWLLFCAFGGVGNAGGLYVSFYLPLMGYTLLFLLPVYWLVRRIALGSKRIRNRAKADPS